MMQHSAPMPRRKLGPGGGSIASPAPFPLPKAPAAIRRPDDGARLPPGIGASPLPSACSVGARQAAALALRLAGHSGAFS
jgi:hypothetical protein